MTAKRRKALEARYAALAATLGSVREHDDGTLSTGNPEAMRKMVAIARQLRAQS